APLEGRRGDGRGRFQIVGIDAGGARSVVDDAVDVRESSSRHDALDLRAAEPRRELAQQDDLALGTCAEIGVPGFGRRRQEAAVHVVKKRLAESGAGQARSEEHTSELQSPYDLVCRLLLEKKNKKIT